ncbi:MAG: VanZ family protein [Pseudomonadota bacterium]
MLAAIYCFVGFYPFKLAPAPPGGRDNGAEVLPGGGLRFQSPGIVQTLDAPSWLQKAIASSDFALSLEVRAAEREQSGPARIFTLSANPNLRNITVGHHGNSLSVRLRTWQTNLNGIPEYWIKNVFDEPGWRKIDIRIRGKALEIRVDGDSLVIGRLPHRPLRAWDANYRLALGNELSGDRPWRGEIRKAVVRVGDQSYDYLLPGALQITQQFHVETVSALDELSADFQFKNSTILDWTINFLGFIPFGWLLGMVFRRRRGILLATLVAAAMSAMIETSQLLILADRFPSVVDFLLNTLGAAAGAWAACNYDLSISRVTRESPG